jgi:hypothetical protein
MRNASGRSCKENQNTLSTQQLFFFENRAFFNVEKDGKGGQATSNNIIRRMCFACSITKAADPQSEYVRPTAFPRQQWLRERVYTYTALFSQRTQAELATACFLFSVCRGYQRVTLTTHRGEG